MRYTAFKCTGVTAIYGNEMGMITGLERHQVLKGEASGIRLQVLGDYILDLLRCLAVVLK